MPSPRADSPRTRSPGRNRGGPPAWIVLVASGVSAALLVAAAFASATDPDLAGQATLARLAGEVADGVVDEWDRLRGDPEPFGAPEVRRWSLDVPTGEVPSGDPAEPDRVQDALLAEVNRRAAAGAPEAAREILATARARASDPVQRAEAWLRTVQLAVAQDDATAAREAWREIEAETPPSLALADGTSVRLLATLAAAPVLALEERAAARDALGEAWARGRLALPPLPPAPDAELVALAFAEPAPRRAALRARLQALLPEAGPDARLERTDLDERAALVTALFGALPAPADGHAHLASAGGALPFELLYRAAGPGALEGRILPRGTRLAALRRALEEHALLPDGFGLDLADGASPPGPVVRDATPLAGSPLAFALRHADPERVKSAFGRRQTWIRVALLGLALATLAAGIATFRALVRERRLVALRSAFVASVSHELRTPIASILLLAENLERGRVSDEGARRRYFGILRREAERLRVLVEDVLDVARLERGESRGEPLAPLDPVELARALEVAARERVAEAGGTLECRVAGLPPRLVGDAEALRRALLNLVENALRHSGSRDLDLSLAGDGVGGLVIRLRDRGRGIPTGERARIFEPFERLEHPEAAAGTGLGLAIVREVARRHGGLVRALAPEEGPGAVLEIHLPRPRGPEDPA